MSGKLRIGLMLSSFRIPAWERLMLEKVRAGGGAEIVLVVLKESPAQKDPGEKKPLLIRAYEKIEARSFHSSSGAMAQKDINDLLIGVPIIRVLMNPSQDGESLESGGVALIRPSGLDILLQTGFVRPRGDITQAARLGVWYYAPCEAAPGQPTRNGPPGFWEVFEGSPVTGCGLYQAVNDQGPDRLLYQSFAATDPLSVSGNINRTLWKSASFTSRAIKNLGATHVAAQPDQVATRAVPTDLVVQTGGTARQSPITAPCGAAEAARAVPKEFPGNKAFAGLFTRYLLGYASNRFSKLAFHTQWHIFYGFPELSGLVRQPASQMATDTGAQFAGFKRLPPPRPAFWSDPFVIYRDGQYYLFFEEFIYRKNRAHISLLILGDDGIQSGPAVVLERPYHLSYPFIFEWEGSLFMVPETAAHRTIEVYCCVEFPYRWELQQTLMDHVKAFDSTLFQHQGKWWMFTNLKENEGASSWDELFLFSADHPLSTQWIPHPQNPIISDVRRARSAGAIFELEGALYRPSQDSSRGYGYRLNFNRILVLNESEYREEFVCALVPDWDKRIRGQHTLNQAGRMVVFDGKSRRLRFP